MFVSAEKVLALHHFGYKLLRGVEFYSTEIPMVAKGEADLLQHRALRVLHDQYNGELQEYVIYDPQDNAEGFLLQGNDLESMLDEALSGKEWTFINVDD